MFSLIITIISIALVTALALATIYYGGTAFKQGQLEARAATVVNQGQQILAAFDLFETTKGRLPNTLDELVPDYLTAQPATAQATPSEGYAGVPSAYAADVPLGNWQLPAPQVATVAIQSGVPLALCKEINRRVRGNNGVLLKAYPDATTQCYGLTADTLNIVVTRDSSTLVAGMGAGNVDLSAPPAATETQSAAWLVPPGGSGTSSGGAGATAPIQYLNMGDSSVITRYNYPATDVGNYSEGYFLVTNSSAQPITFDSPAATVEAPFDVWYDNCAGVTLAPGATCDIEVDYAPVEAGLGSGASSALHLSAVGVTLPGLLLTGTVTPEPSVSANGLMISTLTPAATPGWPDAEDEGYAWDDATLYPYLNGAFVVDADWAGYFPAWFAPDAYIAPALSEGHTLVGLVKAGTNILCEPDGAAWPFLWGEVVPASLDPDCRPYRDLEITFKNTTNAPIAPLSFSFSRYLGYEGICQYCTDPYTMVSPDPYGLKPTTRAGTDPTLGANTCGSPLAAGASCSVTLLLPAIGMSTSYVRGLSISAEGMPSPLMLIVEVTPSSRTSYTPPSGGGGGQM